MLEKGSVQRKEPNSRDSLHRRLRALCGRPLRLQPGGRRPRLQAARARDDPAPVPRQERGLSTKIQEGRFRAELHDRLSSWLYPLAMMMIAFAALGDAAHDPPGPRHRHRGAPSSPSWSCASRASPRRVPWSRTPIGRARRSMGRRSRRSSVACMLILQGSINADAASPDRLRLGRSLLPVALPDLQKA